jgi:hypothetical protein
MTEEKWNSIQESYPPEKRISYEARKAQKKAGQEMHKALRALGIKAQLKGANNDHNQAVIGLSKGLFLLINMREQDSPLFCLSDDREGANEMALWERPEDVIAELGEFIAQAREPLARKEAKLQEELATNKAELEKRFGISINVVN